MDTGGDVHRLTQIPAKLFGQSFGGKECFMRRDISTLGKFHVPLVRVAVAADDDIQAIPLEAVTHRAIETVYGRP